MTLRRSLCYNYSQWYCCIAWCILYAWFLFDFFCVFVILCGYPLQRQTKVWLLFLCWLFGFAFVCQLTLWSITHTSLLITVVVTNDPIICSLQIHNCTCLRNNLCLHLQPKSFPITFQKTVSIQTQINCAIVLHLQINVLPPIRITVSIIQCITNLFANFNTHSNYE